MFSVKCPGILPRMKAIVCEATHYVWGYCGADFADIDTASARNR